jgi:hypothetical protein
MGIAFYNDCLTNLQFAFEFVRRFIIKKNAFWSNEVEDCFIDSVVFDVSADQLRIHFHTEPLIGLR